MNCFTPSGPVIRRTKGAEVSPTWISNSKNGQQRRSFPIHSDSVAKVFASDGNSNAKPSGSSLEVSFADLSAGDRISECRFLCAGVRALMSHANKTGFLVEPGAVCVCPSSGVFIVAPIIDRVITASKSRFMVSPVMRVSSLTPNLTLSTVQLQVHLKASCNNQAWHP